MSLFASELSAAIASSDSVARFASVALRFRFALSAEDDVDADCVGCCCCCCSVGTLCNDRRCMALTCDSYFSNGIGLEHTSHGTQLGSDASYCCSCSSSSSDSTLSVCLIEEEVALLLLLVLRCCAAVGCDAVRSMSADWCCPFGGGCEFNAAVDDKYCCRRFSRSFCCCFCCWCTAFCCARLRFGFGALLPLLLLLFGI